MSHIDSPERQHQLPAAVIIPAFEHEQWFQHLCSRMSCWEAFDFQFELLTFQHLPCSQCNIEKLKYISVLSLFYSGHSELWEFTIISVLRRYSTSFKIQISWVFKSVCSVTLSFHAYLSFLLSLKYSVVFGPLASWVTAFLFSVASLRPCWLSAGQHVHHLWSSGNLLLLYCSELVHCNFSHFP